jgi:ribosomal-protein-alanine N-acetyltransferase
MTDSTALTLGEGGLDDLGRVMDIMRGSFDPAYGEAWTAPQCAGLLPLPGVWLTLARRDAVVVGFALGRVVAAEAELLLLAVTRAVQQRGVGTALLQCFVSVAKARGATRLHLEVRDGNPALTLYTKAGFEEVGRRRNYYHGLSGQLFDALTLARPA